MYAKNLTWRTPEGTRWLANIFNILAEPEYQSQFDNIRNNFDSSKHALEVDLEFGHPQRKLFTKEGKLSSMAHDLSNCEKLIIDAMFDEKFNEGRFPLRLKNLAINDKHIIRLGSRKLMTPESLINVKIQIVNLSSAFNI